MYCAGAEPVVMACSAMHPVVPSADHNLTVGINSDRRLLEKVCSHAGLLSRKER